MGISTQMNTTKSGSELLSLVSLSTPLTIVLLAHLFILSHEYLVDRYTQGLSINDLVI